MRPAAIAAQVRAARPAESSWVSANAGSGKTRVLTDRVARLLLAGTDPQKILCLTYTKAAAAEMQNRLYGTLGAWAMLDDGELREALTHLGEPGESIAEPALRQARTLFARALETPGGLQIQTIHAFCDSLLRRFPLEAGVAPRFTVMEERQARALRAEVLDALALSDPEAMAGLARHLSGDDPDPLLLEVARNRASFVLPPDTGALARALGAAPGDTVATLHAAALTPEARAVLAAWVQLLAASDKVTDCKTAAAIEAALQAPDPATALVTLEGALLKGFEPRVETVPTKKLAAQHPDLKARLDAVMLRIAELRPRRLGIAALAKSTDLGTFAQAYLAAYDARKRTMGLLDFEDLIERARLLLERPDTAGWVLWRLDGGIDHILVDEAQDTSPAQWRVIGAISEEFLAGVGARQAARTIFVVGDEKQSIYSFQGADPAAFGGMRARFAALFEGMGAELQRCDLLHSFRSSRPILALVDAVLNGPAGEGLERIAHHAIDTERPGRVELWPFLQKPERPEEPPWDRPLDARGVTDPVPILAGRIARQIADWLASGRTLPGRDGPITAGDVLILVQRRGDLFHAIIRALKQAEVPVAGADVLRIGGELAVRDLLAVLRVAATPGDDLSLAAVLRSPLGGLSEEDLFTLAHGRDSTLWGALRARPEADWPELRAMVAATLAGADYLRPFELLSRILVRHDGRRQLTARLGPEAEDGIDALLDQALAYESVEAPSLTGFLDWIDRDELTIKRRVEDGAGQVRVMTVHGAKGLEAPIVILPDTAMRQDHRHPPQILTLGGGVAAWRMPSETCGPAMAEAETERRRLVRAENRRLLYVALTRARSWLIVCGAGAPSSGGESWHDLVAGAMEGLAAETEAGPGGEMLVLQQGWTATSDATVPAPPGTASPPAPGPLAHAEQPKLRMIAPSSLGGAHVLAGDDPVSGGGGASGEDEAARARGTAVHRLLEVLHPHPPEAWPKLAARLLPGRDDRDDLLAEAAAVLTHPDFAAIFAPDALAEVGISAALGDGRLVGRIDRLVVGPERVLAVDFKTNRLVPETEDAVPEGILRQMGAYRLGLAAIWPGRPIETAILWTRAPRLMRLTPRVTEAALARTGHLDPQTPHP